MEHSQEPDSLEREMRAALKALSSTSKDYLQLTNDINKSIQGLRRSVEGFENEAVKDRRNEVRKTDTVTRIVIFFIGLVLSVQVTLIAWMTNRIFDHSNRLSRMEGNRFTAMDGSKIVERIHQIEKSIPKEVPPAWFLNEVRDLEKRIDKIDNRR